MLHSTPIALEVLRFLDEVPCLTEILVLNSFQLHSCLQVLGLFWWVLGVVFGLGWGFFASNKSPVKVAFDTIVQVFYSLLTKAERIF